MSVARSLAMLFAILICWMSAKADDPIAATPVRDADTTGGSTAVVETSTTTDAPTKGGFANETVTIPLESIWSNAVRGAKSLRSLEPEINRSRTPEETEALRKLTPEQIKEKMAKAVEKSLVLQIERADIKVARDDKEAPPGFAVQGVGYEALRGAHKVLVQGEKPKQQFSADDPVSIVFYSLKAQPGVGIDRIERKGSVITVYYFVRSHGLLAITWHLSLIPLGDLQPGEYQVNVVRSKKKHDQKGFTAVDPTVDRLLVSRPFDFTVSD